MTKEDKDLVIKDMLARLPYGLYVKRNNETIPFNEGIENDVIGSFGYLIDSLSNKDVIKPYLRPMSSMTEEEQDEFLNLIIPVDGGKAVVEESKIDEYTTFLNSHHFDYRGLIEKGLALEAVERMYN